MNLGKFLDILFNQVGGKIRHTDSIDQEWSQMSDKEKLNRMMLYQMGEDGELAHANYIDRRDVVPEELKQEVLGKYRGPLTDINEILNQMSYWSREGILDEIRLRYYRRVDEREKRHEALIPEWKKKKSKVKMNWDSMNPLL
jgi:hypothetical protein